MAMSAPGTFWHRVIIRGGVSKLLFRNHIQVRKKKPKQGIKNMYFWRLAVLDLIVNNVLAMMPFWY
jgi:hypothetical protein